MISFFTITTMLIFRSRGSRWHNSLRAYTALGYLSDVKNFLKLKPVKSKWYYTALHVVNTSFFKHVGQASNKSDFEFRKSEERYIVFGINNNGIVTASSLEVSSPLR